MKDNIRKRFLCGGMGFLFFLILCFWPYGRVWGYAIVSNATSSVAPEDSICVPFFNLDSLGRNIGGLDTTRVIVFDPGGDSVFSEVLAGVTGRVKISVDAGDTAYRWVAQVSDIDAASPQCGQYNVKIVAKSDQTGGWLKTSKSFSFQVISRKFDAMAKMIIDSLQAVIDSLQNHSNWAVKAVSDSTNVKGLTGAKLGYLDASIASRSVFNNNTMEVIISPGHATNKIYADTIANRVLEDSAHYQGDDEGGGLYARSLVILDSTLEQTIPGVNIVVYDLTQTVQFARGTTNSQGIVGFNLGTGNFLAVPFSPGYIFESFDTLIVAGAGIDTIRGCRFDPGAPALPGLCRLYGFLYDIGGAPESGAIITAWLPAGVSRSQETIISPFKKTTVSDSTGYFYIDLIPSAGLIPDTTKYEIIITRSDGTILRERILLPALPSWQLNW